MGIDEVGIDKVGIDEVGRYLVVLQCVCAGEVYMSPTFA